MAQVFLSYARDDVGRAKPLAAAIERAGYSVWWDRELIGGAEYSREINDALKAADVIVVLWSIQSVDSAWVRDEAAAGRDTGRLVPVRLDSTELPLGFRQYQTIDLSSWNGRSQNAGLKTLNKAIRAKVENTRGADSIGGAATAEILHSQTIPHATLIAGLLILIVAAAGYYWYSSRSIGEVPTIAIVAASDAADRKASVALARTLSVDIGSLQTAATDQFELLDDAANAGKGADYLVKVSAPRGGPTASADLSLLSSPDSRILWTMHFEKPAKEHNSLRLQATTRLAAVLTCLMEASSASGRQLAEATLKLYLRGCEKSGDEFSEMPDPDRLRLFQQVIQSSPNFAPALAYLALLEANADQSQAARKHLEEARRLNPRLGKIYLAERNLTPRAKWRERQQILERGLQMSPDDAELHDALAFDLSQVGRWSDAVALGRRAVELNPLSPSIRTGLIGTLSRSGRIAEAERELHEAEKIWPDSKMVIDARYAFDMRLGDPSNALRMLRESASLGSSLRSSMATPNPGIEAFLRARINPTPANIDKAIDAYMARLKQEPKDRGSLLISLGVFGRTDKAYEILAHPSIVETLPYETEVLFRSYMRTIRHDPRFISLANRVGLLRYWTKTDKWPDFCEEPDLPYDCKKEAQKYN